MSGEEDEASWVRGGVDQSISFFRREHGSNREQGNVCIYLLRSYLLPILEALHAP